MPDDYKMYIVVRADLDMPPGKLAVQVAHAAIGIYQVCLEREPKLMVQYNDTGLQKKICIRAKNLHAIIRVQEECEKMHIPTYTVTDSGLTVFKEPTITVLAIAPVPQDALPKFVQKLQLY